MNQFPPEMLCLQTWIYMMMDSPLGDEGRNVLDARATSHRQSWEAGHPHLIHPTHPHTPPHTCPACCLTNGWESHDNMTTKVLLYMFLGVKGLTEEQHAKHLNIHLHAVLISEESIS